MGVVVVTAVVLDLCVVIGSLRNLDMGLLWWPCK